jgi:serine O-acetyltransferase
MKREIPPDEKIVETSREGTALKRWQLDRIVAELRISREETHSIRRDGEARRAPSRVRPLWIAPRKWTASS